MNKLPNETNYEHCKRIASDINAEELCGKLMMKIVELESRRRGRGGLPLWSIVGELTSHGSGVSCAIVERFLPDYKE